MWAICRASLRALMRSPSAIIFSVVFPFIFILVFGFIGGGGPTIRIAMAPNSDSTNPVYYELRSIPNIRMIQDDPVKLHEDLEKGRLTAIVDIRKNGDSSLPKYIIHTKTSTAAKDRIQIYNSIINSISVGIDRQMLKDQQSLTQVEQPEIIPGRVYRTIDFILPGQLGFSLLSSGVFGIAFMFFNLRQTMVLKRFYATPINRMNIVLGEVMARTIFQLIVTAIILLCGKYFFNYTLVNGFLTILEILLLSFVGLMVFMGFGFVVSGRAKSDSSIPPFANLITLPQFLLGGTFFAVEAFPSWLQPISKVLPLTHLNTAMRDIAFEGAHIWNEWEHLGVLALWGVGIYALAIRTFKWE